ncbi:unnamed protein product [Trifolium pratense]|uniref:Uncharacterized protein n=1 Tax=Trifolium pratense TaxID=57577 RepID=A0ACB0J719_TRIPR|nr:unnamed protein product [Trifolium pratense]
MNGNGGSMFTSQQGLDLIPSSTMSNASVDVASNNWPQSFINNGTLSNTSIPDGNSDRSDSGAGGSGNGGAGGYDALTPNQWSDLSRFNSPRSAIDVVVAPRESGEGRHSSEQFICFVSFFFDLFKL